MDFLEKDVELSNLKALIFLNLRQYNHFFKITRKILSHKNDVLTWALIGLCLQTMKQYNNATSAYSNIFGTPISMTPEMMQEVFANAMVSYKKSRKIETCQSILEDSEKMFEDPDLYFNILYSITYLENQQYSKALKSLEKIDFKEWDHFCIEIKCRALFMLNRYNELNEFLNLINKNFPDYPKKLLFISDCKKKANELFNLNLFEPALEIINIILKKQPDDFETLDLKFNCLFNQSKFKDATEALEQAFLIQGSYLKISSNTIFKFVECSINFSNYREGIDCLEEYQSFHPTSLELRNWLISHLIPQLNERIDVNSRDLDLKACRAAAYLLTAQFDKCNDDLCFIMKEDPKHLLSIVTIMRKSMKLHLKIFDYTTSYEPQIDFHYSGTKNCKKNFLLFMNYLIATGQDDNLKVLISGLNSNKDIIILDPGDILIAEAYLDFKNKDKKACSEKILRSFEYESHDPEFYSKRAILSCHVQLKKDPLEDFEKALKLNPNHIPTLRFILPQLILDEQYKRVSKILTKLEKYYAQFSNDVLNYLPSKKKKSVNNNGKSNSHVIESLVKRKGLNLETGCSKFLDFYIPFIHKYPFQINFNEWTLLALGAFKTWFNKITRKKLLIYKSPITFSAKNRLKNFVNDLINKLPISKHETKENEKMIVTNLFFKDPKISAIVKSVCDQYQILASIENELHLQITIRYKKYIEFNFESFFDSIDKKVSALNSKNEPAHPSPRHSAPSNFPDNSFSFIQEFIPVKKGPKASLGGVNAKQQKTLKIQEAIRKRQAKEVEKEKEKEKEVDSKPPKIEQQVVGTKKKKKKKKANLPKPKPKPTQVGLKKETSSSLPLTGGTAYRKSKEETVELIKRAQPAILPVNAQVPEFSEAQTSNLKSAIKSLIAMEDRVNLLRRSPQLKFVKAERKRERRALEYHLLRALEAIDPTGYDQSFREDFEYRAKMALSLGSLDEIRKIRNTLRSCFFLIPSTWVFKLANELAKRTASQTLFNLIEKQKSVVNAPLTKTLKKISDEAPLLDDFLKKFEKPSKKDDYFISRIKKEFEVLKTCSKEEETFYSFSQVNQNIGTAKKCLSNIQKLTTFLSEEIFLVLSSFKKFEMLKNMGVCIAHDIPEALPIGEEDEISLKDLFSLCKDREFFKEMFDFLDSLCRNEKNELGP